MGIPEQSPYDVQKLINHVMKREGAGIVNRRRAVRSRGASGCLTAEQELGYGGRDSVGRAEETRGAVRGGVERTRRGGGAWHLKWERTRGWDSWRAR